MRRIILVARRTKVDDFVSNTNFNFLPGLELFARMAVLILLSATNCIAGIRRTVFVRFPALEAKYEAPTTVTFALERVEHEHRAVVAYGLGTVGHGRHRI